MGTVPLASVLAGILGGMGPQAGLDVAGKILSESLATTDQEHIPFVVFSIPGEIGDRTAALNGRDERDPVAEIVRQLRIMASLGVTTAALACNTIHAEVLFSRIKENLERHAPSMHLLHLIDETLVHIRKVCRNGARIGILGTLGTYRHRIYEDALLRAGYEPVLPETWERRNRIHNAIYNPEYGIKAQSNPVTATAREHLMGEMHALRDRTVDAILLGCTEVPLAISESTFNDCPLIDPSRVLARALIRATYPDRLRSSDRSSVDSTGTQTGPPRGPRI